MASLTAAGDVREGLDFAGAADGQARLDVQARRREERLVYMNGFARAVPTFVISDAARRLLENWGPYTQSFDRVVPVLQPDRLQTVMDDLLCRSVGLLSATTGNAVDTMDVVRRPG